MSNTANPIELPDVVTVSAASFTPEDPLRLDADSAVLVIPALPKKNPNKVIQ